MSEARPPCAIRTSFQFKLFLIFTILSFFSSCAFIALHAFDKVRETRGHARKEVLLRARQLADSIRLPLYAEDRASLVAAAQQAGRVPGVCRVVIAGAKGTPLAEFSGCTGGCEDCIGESVEVTSLSGGVSGIDGEGAPALIGTVRIERRSDDLKNAIWHDIGLSAVIALLFWLAMSSLGFLVLRRVTRSYEALVSGVEAMKEGRYASRIPIVSEDEPGRVAHAVNGLAETLQRREEENSALYRDLVSSIETEVLARQELAAANRSLAQENQERIQAEQASRESEQTLKTVMDLMPVGVALTGRDGAVHYVNQFLVDRFGYGREEIPTLEAWFSLVFPDAAYRESRGAAQREALAQARDPRGGEAKPYHALLTCKSGEVRHVLFSVEAEGERAVVVVVDITERELMQEQLNKVQKLESLGVLAGGIAHNFNNALTGVMGFISLARCSLDESHDSRKYLQLAEKASLRAAGMARQLLTFARGGAPVKRSVSLGKLVDEVVSLTLNGSNIGCSVQVPDTLPPVKADEGQMVQALSNIVINAMQAMPGGGMITFRAEPGSGTCRDPGHAPGDGYVTLSISDQGHGIAEADLPRIFDPYFSTKETTGLGLASVHSIVYRHGGHVLVRSKVGVGTTFTLCLPSARSSAPGEEEAASPACRGAAAGGTVLVMDDDPSVRELSDKMLAFLGYRAVVCADGREAVALYRSQSEGGNPFLAAVLDLTVPGGMGGVEAAREILAGDPGANLIVSSGYSYDPVMAQYRKYGFRGAVAKPYRAEELGHELGLLQ